MLTIININPTEWLTKLYKHSHQWTRTFKDIHSIPMRRARSEQEEGGGILFYYDNE